MRWITFDQRFLIAIQFEMTPQTLTSAKCPVAALNLLDKGGGATLNFLLAFLKVRNP